jgi:hypothetical protein
MAAMGAIKTSNGLPTSRLDRCRRRARFDPLETFIPAPTAPAWPAGPGKYDRRRRQGWALMRAESRVSELRRRQLAVFCRLRGREAGSAVAQDAPVSDPGLATRRNPANVGLRASARKAIFDVYDMVRKDALARQGVRGIRASTVTPAGAIIFFPRRAHTKNQRGEMS